MNSRWSCADISKGFFSKIPDSCCSIIQKKTYVTKKASFQKFQDNYVRHMTVASSQAMSTYSSSTQQFHSAPNWFQKCKRPALMFIWVRNFISAFPVFYLSMIGIFLICSDRFVFRWEQKIIRYDFLSAKEPSRLEYIMIIISKELRSSNNKLTGQNYIPTENPEVP